MNWNNSLPVCVFLFAFLCHLTPNPPQVALPRSPTNDAGSPFAPFSPTRLEWTVKPNRCVWEASTEAAGGGRGGGGGKACLYRRSFQGDYRRAAQLLRQRASLLQVLQTVHLPLMLDAWRKIKKYTDPSKTGNI